MNGVMTLRDSLRVLQFARFSFFRFFVFSKKFWLGGAAPQTPRILAGGASPPQSPPLTGLAGGLPPPGPPAFFFSPSDDMGAADDTGAADAVGSKYFAKQVYGAAISTFSKLQLELNFTTHGKFELALSVK